MNNYLEVFRTTEEQDGQQFQDQERGSNMYHHSRKAFWMLNRLTNIAALTQQNNHQALSVLKDVAQTAYAVADSNEAHFVIKLKSTVPGVNINVYDPSILGAHRMEASMYGDFFQRPEKLFYGTKGVEIPDYGYLRLRLKLIPPRILLKKTN